MSTPIKVSELTELLTITSDDYFVINDSGSTTTKRASFNTIANWLAITPGLIIVSSSVCDNSRTSSLTSVSLKSNQSTYSTSSLSASFASRSFYTTYVQPTSALPANTVNMVGTASYSLTASYVNGVLTSSNALTSLSSSYAFTSSWASTSSYSLQPETVFAYSAKTSSYASASAFSSLSLSASFASASISASYSLSSSYSLSASYAINVGMTYDNSALVRSLALGPQYLVVRPDNQSTTFDLYSLKSTNPDDQLPAYIYLIGGGGDCGKATGTNPFPPGGGGGGGLCRLLLSPTYIQSLAPATDTILYFFINPTETFVSTSSLGNSKFRSSYAEKGSNGQDSTVLTSVVGGLGGAAHVDAGYVDDIAVSGQQGGSAVSASKVSTLVVGGDCGKVVSGDGVDPIIEGSIDLGRGGYKPTVNNPTPTYWLKPDLLTNTLTPADGVGLWPGGGAGAAYAWNSNGSAAWPGTAGGVVIKYYKPE